MLKNKRNFVKHLEVYMYIESISLGRFKRIEIDKEMIF